LGSGSFFPLAWVRSDAPKSASMGEILMMGYAHREGAGMGARRERGRGLRKEWRGGVTRLSQEIGGSRRDGL
jgi:hypothetical protein